MMNVREYVMLRYVGRCSILYLGACSWADSRGCLSFEVGVQTAKISHASESCRSASPSELPYSIVVGRFSR